MIETYSVQVAIGLTIAGAAGATSYAIAKKRAAKQEREKWAERVEELETVLMTGGDYWFGDSVLDVIEAHNEKIRKNGARIDDTEVRIQKLEDAIKDQSNEVEKLQNRINRLREANDLEPV